MPQETCDLSIILSIHNEQDSLQTLIRRIVCVMEHYTHALNWEVIMVDDASSDGSWEIMQELKRCFPAYVVLAQHREQRGQKGCQMTGFAMATGHVSILMDSDLEVLPEELPRVLDKALLEDYEMVCTYNDPARGGKRRGWVSRIGNIFMKILFQSPVQDAGGNFMAVQTYYVRQVKLIANDHRYLLPIAKRRGLKKIAEVPCIFEVRTHGRSNYNIYKKALQGIPEMLALKVRLLLGVYDVPALKLPMPSKPGIFTEEY